ncbi:SDR family NAD(P)-dependent oxidoreductase [Rhodococcus marinonascens]|uniref:SDR family NAD(P)-dependent oxidoreductase n=1 Tax=Rhodococcus marinonascens TaxID=38311 RepID=UPI000934209B|nr:SDR family oxidoreductase [Rhodococcus marinonascens]
MGKFDGRRVVVTGAGSGIGYEISRLFLAEGGEVVAADRDPRSVPPGSFPVKVDISSPDEIDQLRKSAYELLGGVDILCNNAGIGSTTSILEATVEEWDRVFAVNARGTFLCMKSFLPGMLEQKFGVIVNTASVAGMIGLRDRASYSASKGAVVALTKQAAVQWAAAGIRCNCVCPGTVDSPWVERLLQQAEDPDAYRAELTARQPMGRLAEPTEVAKAVLYLASDDAAFVTGAELVIDGGILAS